MKRFNLLKRKFHEKIASETYQIFFQSNISQIGYSANIDRISFEFLV